ncbi:MAG: leucine-rich repeat domain-containing protein, partial [Solobacterium sp.]|nr:leucine-rich repeat domain-containing protein [Solobacterium sp.]
MGIYTDIASKTIECDRSQREAVFTFTGAEIINLFDTYYSNKYISVTAYAPGYPTGDDTIEFETEDDTIGEPVLSLILPEVIIPDDEESIIIPYNIEPGAYPFSFTATFTAYDTSRFLIDSSSAIYTDAGYNGTIRIPDDIMAQEPAFIGIEIQNFQDAIDREGNVDTDLSGLIRVPTNLQSWGTWGDLDWAVSNSGVLTICGTGGMNSFASDSTDAWQAEKENILSVVIEEGVNSIGSYAFSGFSNLTSVTIADSVEGIGESAFSGCTALTAVQIPDEVDYISANAFYGCSSLSAVDLSENQAAIGAAAFAYCSSLESITLPESLTVISDSAFESCAELASILIPDSVTILANNAFRNCTSLTQVSIGKGVQMIPTAAFSGCTALQNVEIDADANLETIYTDAFSGCTSLASFPFPDSTYVIYDNAFNGCTSLTSVSIPAGVVKIFESSFRNCTSLIEIQVHADNAAYSSVNGLLLDKAGATLIAYPAGRSDTNLVIPAGVKTIGPGAFYGCTGLTGINLNEVNSVSEEAFFGCTGLENLIAPNGVFGVGNNAFANCDSINTVNYLGQEITLNGVFASGKSGYIGYLFGNNKTLLFMGNGVPASDLTASSVPVWKTEGVKRVIVPDYIYAINKYTFYGCTSLESVSIGKDLSQIGEYAFSGCTAMREISFTGNCYRIDDYAFSNCTALTGITLPDSCSSMGNYVFDNCTSLAGIHLPEGCYSVGDYAFHGCTALETVSLGSHLTSIGKHIFHDCTSLTSVSLPEGVTDIGEYAFYGCSSMRGTMSIPRSVTKIGREAFRGCAGLTAFAVDPDNTAYASENGALYDKNISTLIAFPRAAGGHYVMPDSVTTIENDALNLCSELNSVTFGNGISQIGANTFFGCDSLNAIHISQSITSIDKNCFASCPNLTEITVDPGNTVYASLNGVLFSKDLTKLYHYPEGRDGDYSIPS